MKKMWLLTTSFPFGEGEDSFINTELDELAGRFDITVIACESPTGKINPSARLPEGVRAVRIEPPPSYRYLIDLCAASLSPFVRADIKHAAPKSVKKRALCYMQAVKYAAKAAGTREGLTREAKSNGPPDMIYAYWHRPPLLAALRNKGELGGPKVICRAHGFDLYEERQRSGYLPFHTWADGQLDGIYPVSRAGYDYYMQRFSVSNPPKARIARLGCPGAGEAGETTRDGLRYDLGIVPYDTPRHDEFKIFSCSHLVPLKRVDKIIGALSLAANNMPGRRITWVHAGGGSEEEALRKQAENLPSNVRWEIMGAVPNEAVRRKLAEGFHCFVTVSESEGGVPVSIAEAFSRGIPAIGTNAGGIPEIINSDTGILLGGDPAPNDIAAAMIEMADMPDEEYNAMRRNAYNLWRDEFDAKKNAKVFAEMLEKLMKR